MRSTFVIADAHGNYRQVLGLLEQEGIKNGEETPFVVQIGDLANCVGGSEEDDLRALALVGPVIDLMLIGNHEHPHFKGPAFTGFWPHLTVRNRLLDLDDRHLIEPSHEVDGILVTHAGISRWMNTPAHPEDGPWENAKDANEELRWAWRQNKLYPVFSAISPERGGTDPGGGILWSDWSEPKTTKFRQLVGHTVGDAVRRRDRAICIDLGGGKKSNRIAGAWIREGKIEVATYTSTPPTRSKPPRRHANWKDG